MLNTVSSTLVIHASPFPSLGCFFSLLGVEKFVQPTSQRKNELFWHFVEIINELRLGEHLGPYPSGDYILEDYDIDQPEQLRNRQSENEEQPRNPRVRTSIKLGAWRICSLAERYVNMKSSYEIVLIVLAQILDLLLLNNFECPDNYCLHWRGA